MFHEKWQSRYFILKHSCLFWYKMTPHVSPAPLFKIYNCIELIFSKSQADFVLDRVSIEDVQGLTATNFSGSKVGYQLELKIDDAKHLFLAFESQVFFRSTYFVKDFVLVSIILTHSQQIYCAWARPCCMYMMSARPITDGRHLMTPQSSRVRVRTSVCERMHLHVCACASSRTCTHK